jgi:hypothetical protein
MRYNTQTSSLPRLPFQDPSQYRRARCHPDPRRHPSQTSSYTPPRRTSNQSRSRPHSRAARKTMAAFTHRGGARPSGPYLPQRVGETHLVSMQQQLPCGLNECIPGAREFQIHFPASAPRHGSGVVQASKQASPARRDRRPRRSDLSGSRATSCRAMTAAWTLSNNARGKR